MKDRVAWESKRDTLARFCGPKFDHACVYNFKSLVKSEEGYNKIIESFQNNWINTVAQVIMVNPLGDKLP